MRQEPQHCAGLNLGEDCFFEEGKEAFREGCDLEGCPYDEGTDGEFGWKRGWRFADKTTRPCGVCGGTGEHPDSQDLTGRKFVRCGRCKGSGTILDEEPA